MAGKSPIEPDSLTLSIVVKVSDQIIQDNIQIISIEISNQFNCIPFAEITLADGSADLITFPISDSEDFLPGNNIEIFAGYGNDDKASIFSGLIVKQNLVISEGESRLIVTCKHKAVIMSFEHRDAEFALLKDGEIIKNVIESHGLKGIVSSTTVIQEMIAQRAATDWDFILSRADFYGLMISCTQKDTIEVAQPDFSVDPILRVAFGESIINFNAELDAQLQAPELEALAWDTENLTLRAESASEPLLNIQGNISAQQLSLRLAQFKRSIFSGAPMEQSELKVLADATLLKMRLSALKGSVSFQGNGLVRPGTTIQLDGVGLRYSGKAFVSSVNHSLNDGQWKTTAGFGLNYTPSAAIRNLNVISNSAQFPAISGLQIATVKNLFEDPQSSFRIQLTLNSTADQQTGIWAQVANFYATSNAGSGFLPEIGDEVIVGFVDSNPRYPVVLGALYSALNAPANPAIDNNNYIKSITTKGNLKISFDDQKKITTLSTPAGNSFVMNDDQQNIIITDQHGNTVTMNSTGIELFSNGDLTLSSKGNISINAIENIELTAKMDIKLKGININNHASSGFTAEGGTTAEIKSSGQTGVKGAIVTIN